MKHFRMEATRDNGPKFVFTYFTGSTRMEGTAELLDALDVEVQHKGNLGARQRGAGIVLSVWPCEIQRCDGYDSRMVQPMAVDPRRASFSVLCLPAQRRNDRRTRTVAEWLDAHAEDVAMTWHKVGVAIAHAKMQELATQCEAHFAHGAPA